MRPPDTLIQIRFEQVRIRSRNMKEYLTSQQSGSAAVASPGRTDRPRAGGRLPDGQGGCERATATEPQRNGRNRNGTEQTVRFKNVYFPNFSFRLFTNISHLFKIFSSLPPIIVYDPVRKNKIVG